MFKLPHAQIIDMIHRGELPATFSFSSGYFDDRFDLRFVLRMRRHFRMMLASISVFVIAGYFTFQQPDVANSWVGAVVGILAILAIPTFGITVYHLTDWGPHLKRLARARPPVLEFLGVSLEDFVGLEANKQEDLAYEKLKALAELKDRLQRELGQKHPQTVEVTEKLRSNYNLLASEGLIKNSGYGQFFRKPQA